MKAKQLAEKLLENPDFDVEFSIVEPDGSPYGIGCRKFSVDVDDVGYSSRVIILGPQTELEA